MRDLANDQKIREFMLEFARSAREHTRVYFTGGATAVLIGWRDSTIDVDIKFEPELDELFRSLPQLKESLQINVELASPGDFIPLLPGWQERSQFIETIGKASYYHYDFYSQALSKIERGHVHAGSAGLYLPPGVPKGARCAGIATDTSMTRRQRSGRMRRRWKRKS